jgi:hypothetical protein
VLLPPRRLEREQEVRRRAENTRRVKTLLVCFMANEVIKCLAPFSKRFEPYPQGI